MPTQRAGALSSDSPDLAYVREGVVFIGETRIERGRDVAVSRDGAWIAWIASRDGNPELYVARPGRRPVRVTFTPRGAERAPDWSPDSRRLVFERGGHVYVTTVDRAEERLLARAAHDPAWSPHGRIAYERDGWIWTVQPDGLRARRLVRGSSPAWSYDNRLAYDRDGALFAGLRRVAEEAHSAAWSPDGRIAFARGRSIWAVGPRGEARLRTGEDPAWFPRPAVRMVLPDLDQHAPDSLSMVESRGRFLLGFRSAVRNVGEGPLELVASRPTRAIPVMRVSQRIRLSTGGLRTLARVGLLRYKHADNHLHWHHLAFETYELRSADGRLLVRDRKSGFCLVDRHPAPGRPAVFTAGCGEHDPRALHVRQGSSPGNTDIYPAHFHGQNLDVTHVPAGLYVLVHRANPRRYITESDYTNNAASVLIRLTRHEGRPSARIVGTCERDERCYR